MTVTRDPNSGEGMKVGNEGLSLGRAKGDNVIVPLTQHSNIAGQSWTYNFDDINPAGAIDNFLHVDNKTNDRSFVFTDMHFWSSTLVGLVRIIKTSGTAAFVSATELTALARHTIAGNAQPSLTVKTDTNITGLTPAGQFDALNLAVLETSYTLNPVSNIILGPGSSLVFQWEPATGEVSGNFTVTELRDL